MTWAQALIGLGLLAGGLVLGVVLMAVFCVLRRT